MKPIELWCLRRARLGRPLNGELEQASAPVRAVCGRLATAAPSERGPLLDGYLIGSGAPASALDELHKVDPDGPPPGPDAKGPPTPCATLSDVRALIANVPWPWAGWLPGGSLTAIAADPGVGKTILCAHLARALWRGEPWPDGGANPFPARTKTLWIMGDRHYQQLMGLMDAYGVPDESVLINAPAACPLGGIDLDDDKEIEALRGRIVNHRPGLVVCDTVGMTTARNLCRPEDANAFFSPLMEISAETSTSMALLTHLSKDAQALGRRIVGACRAVWTLTRPDPEGQPDRRRLWVSKSYLQAPPALGMTIGETGCAFDGNPPAPANASGTPADKLSAAKSFVAERLSGGDQKAVDVVNAWLAKGEGKATIFRAKDAMVEAGRLVVDDSRKPQIWHLVKDANGAETAF